MIKILVLVSSVTQVLKSLKHSWCVLEKDHARREEKNTPMCFVLIPRTLCSTKHPKESSQDGRRSGDHILGGKAKELSSLSSASRMKTKRENEGET